MRVALFLDDPAAIVDPGGAEKARDVERVGKPIELDRKVPLEFVGGVLRQKRIRALVVEIYGDGSPLGHALSSVDIADVVGRPHLMTIAFWLANADGGV
jgi:hypothetical protein